MNSRGHFFMSLAKSVIRMIGCGVAIRNGDIKILAFAFAAAEILGIGEELIDKR